MNKPSSIGLKLPAANGAIVIGIKAAETTLLSQSAIHTPTFSFSSPNIVGLPLCRPMITPMTRLWFWQTRGFVDVAFHNLWKWRENGSDGCCLEGSFL